MPSSWIDSVRQSGQLSIFPGKTATGGGWATTFNTAITRFNTLANLLNLGVTFTASNTPPDPNGFGGANVAFETGNGQVSFNALGGQFSRQVDGNALGGNTFTISTSTNSGDRIAKAFIFVPATPRSGNAKSRVVGDGVKLVIAVHEFVHACGLSNADHSPGSKPDVFYGFPTIDVGSTAADDRIRLPDGRTMPPVWMANETAGLIQSVW
jgi:hypothetical protein